MCIIKTFVKGNNWDLKSGKHKEGTGLGLYLSKKLANLLDGNLIIESEFGKGSTFTLS
ncbi:MAG: hypothetical protein KGD58_16890 [Candidatus Lokiarchaeota archaeon]|nr:hypothetical protein [Candidatus Lokiarchaeota archaeon]